MAFGVLRFTICHENNSNNQKHSSAVYLYEIHTVLTELVYLSVNISTSLERNLIRDISIIITV